MMTRKLQHIALYSMSFIDIFLGTTPVLSSLEELLIV